MDTRMTVRVPRKYLDNAKRYARAHNTTLTELVTAYLQHFPLETESFDQAPVVRQLTGILSKEVSLEDYRAHLDEKYGQR